MDDPKKILMVGDTHGNSGHVEWAAARAEASAADAMFVLGDFGYWEHGDDGFFLDKCSAISSDYGIPIYWLDGNHENHTWLRERYINNESVPRDEYGFVQIRKGLFHAPRAHTWEWSGYSFMALGGAYSIDVEGRLIGEQRKARQARAEINGRKQQGAPIPDIVRRVAEGEHTLWWPEEEISDEEIEEALKVDRVDILLTHDKPLFSEPDWNRKNDPTSMDNQEKVQKALEHLKPRILMHGHLHYSYQDEMLIGADENGLQQCTIYGLDCDPWFHEEAGTWWYRPEQSLALMTLGKKTIKVANETAREAAERYHSGRVF
jgi:predicted phosphodiesterase